MDETLWGLMGGGVPGGAVVKGCLRAEERSCQGILDS